MENLEVNGEIFVTGGLDIETRLQAVESYIASLPADLPSFPNDLALLTSAEVQQLANIGSNVINNTQWGYVSSMQDVAASADPAFNSIAIATDYGIGASGVATVAQSDGYDAVGPTTYTGYNGVCDQLTMYNGIPYACAD